MLTTDFQLVKSDPVAGATSAPIHVLAIDDDPSVRQMIADYLGDNDIQVTTLAGGQAIADVMARQRAGDASGSLVVTCSPGGSMYRYFSGDAVTEATMVFRWMVYYNALQSR